MEKIIEACKDLDFSWLPPTIADFTLTVERTADDAGYHLFSYENDKGWRWEALYDKEVEDYTVHVRMPLFEFTDISFVREEVTSYWDGMKARCVEGLTSLLITPEKGFTYAYNNKQLPTWKYEDILPPSIGEFVRDITPDKAIRMINGSYIICEYCRPDDRSGLLLFYNVLRDEFFAELRRHNFPEISHRLDANTLPKLEQVLREHLEDILTDLAGRL